MSRPVIGYRVVRAACDLLGRVDATKRAEQRTDYDEIMQAVHDLLEPLYPGTSSFVYPRRGPGSVMGDWLRWYRDAYELEARCTKCDGHGKLEGVDCDGCEGTGAR